MMRILIAFALSLFTINLFASTINVYPLSVEFAKPNQRYKDITVYNTGSDTAYVNVEVVKVANPGHQNLNFIPMRDNPSKFGMIASPNKLIIPKGQSRVVRVLKLLQGNQTEAVYHVNITPATGVIERMKTGNKAIEAGVRVIVGYNVNVLVLPKQPKAHLVFTRKGKTVTVKNTGNASALLYKGEQCIGKTCMPLPTKRMYAGLTWSFTLKPNAKYHYAESFNHHQVKRVG